MKYKGFEGAATYDGNVQVFRGTARGEGVSIGFQASGLGEVREVFERAVDGYLQELAGPKVASFGYLEAKAKTEVDEPLREELGRIAYGAWLKWAESQSNIRPVEFHTWEQASEESRECCRCLGEAVYRFATEGKAS